MAAFERNYEQIANTELWRLLQQRSEEQGLGQEFVSAVKKVCAIGLDLSKDIIRFFPNFTFHDGSHSTHVCDWMARLLGERIRDLTAHEAALLLMAACCHDIGMSVSDAQKQKLADPKFSGWKEHFAAHLDDDEEFCRTGVISGRMLRNYVRLHHHERIRENLRQSDWPRELSLSGLPWDALLILCKSHGTTLSCNELKNTANYDLLLCAVLLRLADLLDYDASRTSDVLLRHMGLDAPQTAEAAHSAQEHHKNKVGTFDPVIRDGVIRYRAVYDDPQVEHDVREYLDWINRELTHCAESLTQADRRWQDLPLPYKISTEDVQRNGYSAGDFCMTMDQDRVIELLAGKNLYSDPGVFVRELLQNSIDAVLMRVRQDPDFSIEEGRIIIDTWPGDAGDTWFRIRDNGTGMDEHIIQNYFLKVGRSYYTSDEFRAANRHAPGGKGYTAISRFGIGILSCFMTDPEGTELKVSTKRFRSSGDNGIRLDVTGLHGYYYLAHEDRHPDYEDSFLQMPSPDGNDLGYREEPGTTICVRTNLFRLGSTQSFLEILDKYVQFPEVRVEYNGPEGRKEYPTQQELMDAVYALNPDGEVREYVHEIPDEWFERIKEVIPIAKWQGKPALVMRYYPIDWLADSEKMKGAVLKIHLQYSASCQMLVLTDRENREQRVVPDLIFKHSISDGDALSLHCYLWKFDTSPFPNQEAELRQMQHGVAFRLTLTGETSILSAQEQRVFDLMKDAILLAEAEENLIAHSGVLVPERDPLSTLSRTWESNRAILLLREAFLPEVNLARTAISRFPTEAACCWAIAADKLDLGISSFLRAEHISMLTTNGLRRVIDLHPVWTDYWKEKFALDPICYSGRLSDCMYLSSCEDHHSAVHDFSIESAMSSDELAITGLPSDGTTAEFPAGMFCWPEKEDSPLVHISWNKNLCNRSHRFSQWLIQNRAQIAENVPALYNTLIRTMLLGEDRDPILNTVNTILTRLRGYNGNCFGIHDGLFLTEDDFV